MIDLEVKEDAEATEAGTADELNDEALDRTNMEAIFNSSTFR